MKKILKKNIFLFSVLTIFLILLDQLSKYIIRQSGGFYICNHGIAFGANFLYFLPLLLVIIFIAVVFWRKNLPSKRIDFQTLSVWRPGLILIIAGALSNIIDRIFFGCVIDFINLKFWPIFNLADSLIFIGALIIILKIKD